MSFWLDKTCPSSVSTKAARASLNAPNSGRAIIIGGSARKIWLRKVSLETKTQQTTAHRTSLTVKITR